MKQTLKEWALAAEDWARTQEVERTPWVLVMYTCLCAVMVSLVLTLFACLHFSIVFLGWYTIPAVLLPLFGLVLWQIARHKRLMPAKAAAKRMGVSDDDS